MRHIDEPKNRDRTKKVPVPFFAPPMLLALEERINSYSVGNPTIEQVEEMMRIFLKYQSYFKTAPFHSFGQPISLAEPEMARI